MAAEQLALAPNLGWDAEERARWKLAAARLHFGRCARCARCREEDGRFLLVARQERCQRFLCFRCWAAQPRRRRQPR